MVSPFSSKTSTVWLAQRSRKTTSSMVSVPEPVASRMLKSDFLSTQSCRDLASHPPYGFIFKGQLATEAVDATGALELL